MKVLLLSLLFIDLLLAVYCVLFGPHPKFLPHGDPTSYRILYMHVPLVWNMYFAFTLALICSILYLRKEKSKYDLITFCSIVLGIIYGIGGISAGMLWAKEVWGSPWSWDPRQTATLVAILSYAGYLALRYSITDVDKARTISSVYAVAAYVTIPLSYISSITFRSLHVQLPQQPLTPEAHFLLAVKVLTSFLLFIALLNYYYQNSKRVRG